MKKYELTYKKDGLYRIKALKSFGDVKEGDLGGWVMGEDNLSHKGNCWIYDEAKIYNNAKVQDDGIVWGNAIARDYAIIRNRGCVGEYAVIKDHGTVNDDGEIVGHGEVSEYGEVYGGCIICNNGKVCGKSSIEGEVQICRNTIVTGDACIKGKLSICDKTIKSNDDFIIFKNILPNFLEYSHTMSKGNYIYTFQDDMWEIGIFEGTTEKLKEYLKNAKKLERKEYSLAIKYVEKMKKHKNKS